MTKLLTIVFLLITCSAAMAQKENHSSQINFTIGRSTHSTGDLKGIIFYTEYQVSFKKRFSWSLSIGGTIHDGSYPLFYTDPFNKNVDGSIRFTTGGFQTTSHLGYSLIQSKKFEFQIKVGPLLRYQSSSYLDQLAISYPIITNYPIPVVEFVNKTPQRTVAFGGSLQLTCDYFINKKFVVGILGGFQADTNGDNITSISLKIGRRL